MHTKWAMASPSLNLLFISDQRALIEGFFALWSEQALLSVATTLADGLRQLGERQFDLVLCDESLESKAVHEVLQYLHAMACSTPVVAIGEEGHIEEVVRAFKAGVTDYVLATTLNTQEGKARLLEVHRLYVAKQGVLEEREQYHQANYVALRKELSKANHDINNPLAIVSGNAQLLLEIGRMMSLDPDLMRPIEDIEEASQRLADLLRRVAQIRDAIPQHPAAFSERH